ncbi:MAG: PQQ-binding-like beta-propeller repeat protein [Gemmataceae bacterium]
MRRTWPLLLLLCCAADWPQLLGPNRDSHSAETLPDAFPAGGPPAVWTRKVGLGFAGVAVADGKCVVFHRVKDEDVVEALDAKTGKPLWAHAAKTDYSDPLGRGDGPRAVPTVAAGRVFTLAANGVLTCLDLADGKKRWDVNLLTAYEVPGSYFGVGTAPLVAGERVLVNVGGEGAGVVAFDVKTGKESWKATGQRASYASPVLAKVGGVEQALFFTRNGLLSLDPATGKERYSFRWRARIDASVNAASPVVIGERVFLSSSYNTGAVLLDATADGVKEVWKGDRSLSCHFNTPVAVGEQLYGVDGRQEEGARLRCIDWRTGKVRWTEEGFGCGSVVAAGKRLLLMSEKGELILANANPDRFEVLGRHQVLSGPVRAHLALAGGMAYCRDATTVGCFRIK